MIIWGDDGPRRDDWLAGLTFVALMAALMLLARACQL